jgi:hypothetical protein
MVEYSLWIVMWKHALDEQQVNYFRVRGHSRAILSRNLPAFDEREISRP